MRGINLLRAMGSIGPRLAAAAAIALLATVLASAAHASSDTHHRRAHQPAASTASKSSKQKPPAKSAHRSTQFIYDDTPHFVTQSKPTRHSRNRAPEPAMHAAAHSTPRNRAREARERAAAQPLKQSFSVHQQLASSHSVSQGQISVQPPVAAKKALTTEDFMRAAGEVPATQATVSAAPPTYAPQPQPQRVDGFGAEGAMLPTTSRRSSAPTPTPGDTTDPELTALSRPSHEELAESALQPRLPNLYSRNGRLIVPAPLVGSHDILVHQNEMADADGLSRIENDAQLAGLRAKHLLVDFTETASLQLNPDLPDNRRCARPWAVKFAADMSRAFYARFHQPLQINSAARTVEYQRHLERVNGNAVGVDGEAASPHLTGQAIDFAKRGMSMAEIAWMRGYLKPLMTAGKLDVEEEFHQSCFHISIYRAYLPTRKSPPRSEVAELGSAGAEK